MFERIVEFLRDHDRFAITSHAHPDGDSIGSELALAAALRGLGKKADIFNRDPLPEAYSGLPEATGIRTVTGIAGSYQALILLECDSLERTGLEDLDGFYSINVDHHPGCIDFADLNWVDASAAAVGILVLQIIRALGAPVTPEIASSLYVAILTDTGSFQYSNTRAGTFRVAAELVDAGADPNRISQMIYRSRSLANINLLARVLRKLEIHNGGRLASISLTLEDLEETGAVTDEIDGFVNYPLSLRDTVVAALFRQEEADLYRISLRSKDSFDVGAVARVFGGGGHRNAAGLLMHGAFSEVRSKVIKALSGIVG